MFDIGQLTGESVPEKIKANKVNSKQHAQLQVAHLDRKNRGISPIPRPWEFLTRFELIDLAWRAYQVATWSLKDDVVDPMAHQHPQQLREAFADALSHNLADAICGWAQAKGGCWPEAAYALAWERLQEGVPADWRPQYPLYKKVTPAERGNAPGVVINADEGNVNGTNSKP